MCRDPKTCSQHLPACTRLQGKAAPDGSEGEEEEGEEGVDAQDGLSSEDEYNDLSLPGGC